jgi:hypothetical protein
LTLLTLGAVVDLPAVVARVPTVWWEQAGVAPQAVADCLSDRAQRIDQIIELTKWEGVASVTQGGRVLGL